MWDVTATLMDCGHCGDTWCRGWRNGRSIAMKSKSSELAEQIALSILLQGEHDSNLEVLRSRLAHGYEQVARRLTALGAELPLHGSGIFLWAKLSTRLNA